MKGKRKMRKQKALWAVLVVMLVAVALGATSISYNIPNDVATAIVTAFTEQSNAHVVINIQGSQGAGDPDIEDYSTRVDFRTGDPPDPNATNGELATFVKRRVARITMAFEKAHRNKLRHDEMRVYDVNRPMLDPNEPDPNDML